MSGTYYLAMLDRQLVDARDTAFRAAAEAEQRVEELRQERLVDNRPDSVFVEMSRDNSADKAREVALASWAANALALASLYLATNGDFGQSYDAQPSPYRTKTNGADVPVSPQGVKQ
jgi:hypothetical protein